MSATTETKSLVSFGEYKGHALLVLGGESRFPFQFGAAKARLLLAAIEEKGPQGFADLLKEFVAKNDPGREA
ncbi:MAG: hypothetical protein HYY93_16925 [Planctomycetes bacterium]|nr:hypothetical protein [Planctomycetota bacterium]